MTTSAGESMYRGGRREGGTQMPRGRRLCPKLRWPRSDGGARARGRRPVLPRTTRRPNTDRPVFQLDAGGPPRTGALASRGPPLLHSTDAPSATAVVEGALVHPGASWYGLQRWVHRRHGRRAEGHEQKVDRRGGSSCHDRTGGFAHRDGSGGGRRCELPQAEDHPHGGHAFADHVRQRHRRDGHRRQCRELHPRHSSCSFSSS